MLVPRVLLSCFVFESHHATSSVVFILTSFMIRCATVLHPTTPRVDIEI
jgi:hypothetical protein